MAALKGSWDKDWIVEIGDMTGVLVQSTPRIPLSYRRKEKAPNDGA